MEFLRRKHPLEEFQFVEAARVIAVSIKGIGLPDHEVRRLFGEVAEEPVPHHLGVAGRTECTTEPAQLAIELPGVDGEEPPVGGQGRPQPAGSDPHGMDRLGIT